MIAEQWTTDNMYDSEIVYGYNIIAIRAAAI